MNFPNPLHWLSAMMVEYPPGRYTVAGLVCLATVTLINILS